MRECDGDGKEGLRKYSEEMMLKGYWVSKETWDGGKLDGLKR